MANDQPIVSDLPTPNGEATGCNPRARHLVYLVYEPRAKAFMVHANGVHELHPRTGQRLATHHSRRTLTAISEVAAEICAKMAGNGLRAPIWSGQYVLLGERVTDRDRVLLAIIDRLKERCPKLEVRIRLTDTECLNDCCRN